MQNLAGILGKKYKAELRYLRAVEIIQKDWGNLVNELQKFLKPKNIYKNKLVIECNNSIWMSEIACFEEQIIIKVNDLLKHKKLKLSVIGIKLVFNSNMVFEDVQSKPMIPNSIEERISWNIKKKKKMVQYCVNHVEKFGILLKFVRFVE